MNSLALLLKVSISLVYVCLSLLWIQVKLLLETQFSTLHPNLFFLTSVSVFHIYMGGGGALLMNVWETLWDLRWKAPYKIQLKIIGVIASWASSCRIIREFSFGRFWICAETHGFKRQNWFKISGATVMLPPFTGRKIWGASYQARARKDLWDSLSSLLGLQMKQWGSKMHRECGGATTLEVQPPDSQFWVSCHHF